MLSRIARRLTEHHELLWRMDRQRLEHERVHQVEDGNVGPDAQREREHGHAAHDRRLPHQAKREAEVAADRVECAHGGHYTNHFVFINGDAWE